MTAKPYSAAIPLDLQQSMDAIMSIRALDYDRYDRGLVRNYTQVLLMHERGIRRHLWRTLAPEFSGAAALAFIASQSAKILGTCGHDHIVLQVGLWFIAVAHVVNGAAVAGWSALGIAALVVASKTRKKLARP